MKEWVSGHLVVRCRMSSLARKEAEKERADAIDGARRAAREELLARQENEGSARPISQIRGEKRPEGDQGETATADWWRKGHLVLTQGLDDNEANNEHDERQRKRRRTTKTPHGTRDTRVARPATEKRRAPILPLIR